MPKTVKPAKPLAKRTVEQIRAHAKRMHTLSPEEAEVLAYDRKLKEASTTPQAQAQGEHADGQAQEHGEGNGGDLVGIDTDPAFIAAESLRIVKRVTIPVLAFREGTTILCRFAEAIRESEVDDGKMGPAKIAQIEARDGTIRLLIVGEVLHTSLSRAYPEDSYVGKWFAIEKREPRADKRYRDYTITEVEFDSAAD